MNELLASDFGFKPQGKSAPMAGSKSTSTVGRSSTRPHSSFNSFKDHRRTPPPPRLLPPSISICFAISVLR
uniref:Uncharacterized protein n=1 Tax=Quercus lobata TaxID=97700 RepID=A0A7N2KQ44_QUELO